MNTDIYKLLNCLTESTFITLMLFFWILIIHSAASVSTDFRLTKIRALFSNHTLFMLKTEQLLSLDQSRFYMPKVSICIFVWIYLLVETSFYETEGIAWSAEAEYHRGIVWIIIRLAGVVILSIYLSYAALIIAGLHRVMNLMKKSYKWIMYATVFVLVTSVSILYLNGSVTLRFEKPVLFAA